MPVTTAKPNFPTYDPVDSGNFPNEGPLRIGGIPVSNKPASEEDLPSTFSPAAEAQQESLKLVRDIWGGTQRVRECTEDYLPKAPGEDTEDYRARLARSVFFNVFKHTVNGLIGFVFRKDPDLGDDVPPVIQEHCENIDLAGTHLDVFARDIMADAETTGHAAILVEFPDTSNIVAPRMPNGKLTREADAIVRPYWVPIKKDDIISWRTTIFEGRQILTQLVLRETQWVADGNFGQKEEVRYRVFTRDVINGTPVVGWQLLGITDKQVVFEVATGVYENQDEIPVAEIASSGRKALFESDPPLLDLAYLNVAHYQMRSDYTYSIHKTCVPIWVETGCDTEEDGTLGPVVLGPNSARRFTNPQAKATYEAHSGNSLASVKNALDDLIRDMAALGLAALASQKRAAETAASKQIDKDATDSTLSVTARGLQDGLERALQFHANYLKLDTGGSIAINRDYEDLTMRSDMLVAYVTAVAQAGLPVRLLLEAMQQGGLIGPDEDLDEVAAEMEAQAQAIADQKAQDAQDKLALAKANSTVKMDENGQPIKPADALPIDGAPPVEPAAKPAPTKTTFKIVRDKKSGKAKRIVSTKS